MIISSEIEGSPAISVIMAVYNSEKYLGAAIESILNQDFIDFEFIIINDGSSDESEEIIDRYARRDRRIQIYSQTNQGLPKSLNRGIDLATGKYIARMDADDLSLPERLSKQFAFMERYPDISICGTWIELIGDEDKYIDRYPTTHNTICCWLLFAIGLAHPSVMMRREILLENKLYYDPSYVYCEDYEFWVRLSANLRLANLPEVLLSYRLPSKQSDRSEYQRIRLVNNQRIWHALLQKLGISPTPEEWETHIALWQYNLKKTKAFVLKTEKWLNKLRTANQRTCIYAEPDFSNYLGDRWFIVCHHAIDLGLWIAWKFRFSPVGKNSSLNPQEKQNFYWGCFKQDIKKILKLLKLRKT